MQAVITVVGTDKVGILAKISGICAEEGVNVEEVTQSILRGTFAMIMMVNIENAKSDFKTLTQRLQQGGEELGIDVHVTRQEIFDAMHRI
ncbi:ACT domain-containing protein [Ruminococcaceae bacterium OttesenSCG-928-A16]|nr:ACT domain-containing protein [Ruminococcaceae bacterium OttesenSCG-928-A16]